MEGIPHANDNSHEKNERTIARTLDVRRLEEMRRVTLRALEEQAGLATEEDLSAAADARDNWPLERVVMMINRSTEEDWHAAPLFHAVLAARIDQFREAFD